MGKESLHVRGIEERWDIGWLLGEGGIGRRRVETELLYIIFYMTEMYWLSWRPAAIWLLMSTWL